MEYKLPFARITQYSCPSDYSMRRCFECGYAASTPPIIEQYKHTDLYLEMHDYLSTMEERNEATFNVMKHQYIDSRKLDEIFKQLHLLSKYDVICVLLVSAAEKTVKIYCDTVLGAYFTDRNTNRKSKAWSELDFRNFSKAENLVNQPYDEAYISVLYFDDVPYFVEHNELLTENEISQMVEIVTGALPK